MRSHGASEVPDSVGEFLLPFVLVGAKDQVLRLTVERTECGQAETARIYAARSCDASQWRTVILFVKAP